ncbi:MAG TPA: UDP-N-acetylmuramate dehydrogenase [Acidobacteriaceae bacterium]
MTISENEPLAPLTTFGIGGPARFFTEAANEADVADAVRWSRQRGVPLFVLGGGSNLLVRDEGFDGLVLHIGIRGVERSGDTFDVGAGENWDPFVQATVDLGYAGVECLAGIPGSVGGTPVQNVGAYGQEVSETIASVRVLDLATGEFAELSNAACRFRYRESLFNTTERGRYIVTRVRFALRPGGAANLRYADLQKRFAGQTAPDLGAVAEAVREIRRAKGMVIVPGDPDTRSAGSFFKNPVVEASALGHVAAAAGVADKDVPHWSAGEGRVKLAAAWLLERAGFVKGYGEGSVAISSRHTLALTNRGGARFADVARMEGEIVHAVEEKFGVTLVREPVVPG